MSRATELAEREAQAAEAEYPEPETSDTDESDIPLEEPPVEPEPDPDALAVVQEQAKRLDGEARRHENALAKIHGDGWTELGICALCLGDGFMRPYPSGSMNPEQWDVIKTLAGQIVPPDLKIAADVDVCQSCDGWGEVITGSKAEGHITKLCATCSGNGYTPKGTQYAPVAPPPAPVLIGGYELPSNGQPKDDWNRPAGHPRYGIDPALLGGQW